jgi:hypothetical protein
VGIFRITQLEVWSMEVGDKPIFGKIYRIMVKIIL